MLSKISFKGTINTNYNISADSARINKTPCNDSVSFTSLTPEQKLKGILDNKIFKFEKKGETFEGTIKEYLESCIINERKTSDIGEIYHLTDSEETANKMIKNGLDWKKAKVIRCGPGTYFAPTIEACKQQTFSRVPIIAKYKGKQKTFPILEPKFYENLENNKEIKETVKKCTGKGEIEKSFKEYYHNLMQNDLGIDVFYCGSGYGVGSYVVLNNDSFKLSKGF